MLQGKIGNCWFVAASSVLAGVPKLWERVVPDARDQDWDPNLPDKYRHVEGSCHDSHSDILVESSASISGDLAAG